MTISTENATPPKSTKSRIFNSSVKIQIKLKSQFEFVPRDTEESEFLNLVDFGGVAFSVEIVIIDSINDDLVLFATNCSTLQHLQHTATRYNALQRIATHCNALKRTATH